MIIRFMAIVLALLGTIGYAQTVDTESTAKDTYVVYEAIFLDNDEVTKLFTSVRGEVPPYANVTQDYHVTTEYMPAQAHPQWYGEQLNIHITAYAAQDIAMDNGQTTSNEGFKVEVTSDNEEFAAYLESLGKNFHITGSYKDGAKYTEYVDFSKGEPLDIYITGTFGGYYSNSTIILKND